MERIHRLLLSKPGASRYVTTFSFNLLGLALATVNSVLLARWLGPAGRGEVAAALLWPTLLISFGSLGQFNAIVYFAAQSETKTEQVFSISLIMAFLISAVLLPLGYWIMPYLLANQRDTVIEAARLFLLIIPMSLLTQGWTNLLRSQLHIASFNFVQILPATVYLVGTIGLFLSNTLSLRNIILVNILHNMLTFFVAFCFLCFYRLPMAFTLNSSLARRMLNYGLQVHIGSLFRSANLRLDQALIAYWLDPRQLGLYVVAVSITNITAMLGNAVQLVAVPSIARIAELRIRVSEFGSIFQRYWWVAILIRLPIAVTLPVLVPLVFGSQYQASVLVAEILLLATLPYDAQTVLMGGAQAFGTPWLSSRTEIIAFGFTIGLLLSLVPVLGITGAAIASVVAYTVAFATLVWALIRRDLFALSNLVRLDLVVRGLAKALR